MEIIIVPYAAYSASSYFWPPEAYIKNIFVKIRVSAVKTVPFERVVAVYSLAYLVANTLMRLNVSK